MVTGTIHFYLGAIRIAQLIQTRGLRSEDLKEEKMVTTPLTRHRFVSVTSWGLWIRENEERTGQSGTHPWQVLVVENDVEK